MGLLKRYREKKLRKLMALAIERHRAKYPGQCKRIDKLKESFGRNLGTIGN